MKRRKLSPAAAGGDGDGDGDASGGRDWISGLPDDLLGAILTLLPAMEAARTPLLSSRWRHVWSRSPLTLDLNDFVFRRRSTLSDLLARHTGHVRLVCLDERKHWLARDGTRLCEPLEGKHIQHLIYTGGHYSRFPNLPHCLISGGSLSKLEMDGCWFHDPAAMLPYLMHLKELKLKLDLFQLSDEPIIMGGDLSALISTLPMLWSLELSVTLPVEFHIHSKTLQRLSLKCMDLKSLSGSLLAPNLQKLLIDGVKISGIYLGSIISSLPKLQFLKLGSHWDLPSLHFCSMSLKKLDIWNLRRLESFAIDAPNLGMLRISLWCIPVDTFHKLISGFPVLHTLELRDAFEYCNFSLASKSLQTIKLYGNCTKMLIVDAPCLQTLYISDQIFNLEVVNAPRLEAIGYLASHNRMFELKNVLYLGICLPRSDLRSRIKTLVTNVTPSIDSLPTRPLWFLKCFPFLETLCITEVDEDTRSFPLYSAHAEEGSPTNPDLLIHLKCFQLRLLLGRKGIFDMARVIVSQASSLERIHFFPSPDVSESDIYKKFLSELTEVVDPSVFKI